MIAYFFAFIAAMTAMRVLIGWMYVNTQSVTIAQLMHACSTGSLVVFSPPRVNAAQEALWYGSPFDHGFYRCNLLREAVNEKACVSHCLQLVAIRTLAACYTLLSS